MEDYASSNDKHLAPTRVRRFPVVGSSRGGEQNNLVDSPEHSAPLLRVASDMSPPPPPAPYVEDVDSDGSAVVPNTRRDAGHHRHPSKTLPHMHKPRRDAASDSGYSSHASNTVASSTLSQPTAGSQHLKQASSVSSRRLGHHSADCCIETLRTISQSVAGCADCHVD